MTYEILAIILLYLLGLPLIDALLKAVQDFKGVSLDYPAFLTVKYFWPLFALWVVLCMKRKPQGEQHDH